MTTKCSRTRCQVETPECWNPATREAYCIRCARRINESSPGLIVMWRQDTRDGRSGEWFISSDGRFILSPIQGRAAHMPKWVLYISPEMRQLGDYHSRWAATHYIVKHF